MKLLFIYFFLSLIILTVFPQVNYLFMHPEVREKALREKGNRDRILGLDKEIYLKYIQEPLTALVPLEVNKETLDSIFSIEIQQNQTIPCYDRFLLEEDQPKPDFFLIGLPLEIARSYSFLLSNHPRIEMPKQSKIDSGFFSFPGISKTDRKTYQRLFTNIHPGAHNDILVGDFSSSYLLHPLTPRRIAASIPDAKVIIILRNPAGKAYSHYTLMASQNMESLSFEEIVNQEMQEIRIVREASRQCFNADICSTLKCVPEESVSRHNAAHSEWHLHDEREWREYLFSSYLFHHLYDDQVERWKLMFPNLLFLYFEDSYKNPQKFYDTITDFLGIERFEFPQVPGGWDLETGQSVYEIKATPLALDSRHTLHQFFEPFNQRLFNIVGYETSLWVPKNKSKPN